MDVDAAIAVCAERFMSIPEVEALCAQLGSKDAHPLDALALDIAQRYMGGTLSFEVADTFMNSIWSYSCSRAEIPALMYSIYQAFDAGEYRHRNDPEGTDSEIKYTRPELARILHEAGAA